MRYKAAFCIIFILGSLTVAYADESEEILEYLEKLRIEEASELISRNENNELISLPKTSQREVIVQTLASGESVSQISLLDQKLGIESVDRETAIKVLYHLWESKQHSGKTAFIGLLRHNYQPAWDVIGQMIEGNAQDKAIALGTLRYVDSIESIRIAGGLLGNKEKPGSGIGIFQSNPISNHAVCVLSQLVTVNNPTGKKELGFITSKDATAWQQWWEENGYKYTDTEQPQANFNSNTSAPPNEGEGVTKVERDIPIGVPTEPIEEDFEPSSKWWLWLIGAVVLVGGIGLIARRKN